MSDQPRYTLKHPIKRVFNAGKADQREEEITELTFRRLKGKDLRVVDSAGGDMAAALALIARSTGLTIAEVDEIDAEDIAGVQEIVENFTPAGPKTGKPS